MIKLSKYLSAERIFFLSANNQAEALQLMVDGLQASGSLLDKELFHQAIKNRESIVSTGIGMGVAVPHAKLPSCPNFFIAMGILQKGVSWNALDDVPVRLIFMIGGPNQRQTEYLQILSALTTEIRNAERRKKILTLNSKEAIIQLFNGN